MTSVAVPEEVRWVPTKQAQDMLGVTRQRIGQLIKSGALSAHFVSGHWMISVKSIEQRQAALAAEVD